MTLWTMQPLSVLEEIETKGEYVCNANLSEELKYANPRKVYDWLVSRMKDKVGMPPSSVEYPVWAWHTTYGVHKRPDLRKCLFKRYQRPFALITIEIPDNEVVLTDYNNWTLFGMNDAWFDDSTSEDEWDDMHEKYNSLPQYIQEEMKIKSWEKFFDVEQYKDDWSSKGFYVQATFWKLKKEHIRKIEVFK